MKRKLRTLAAALALVMMIVLAGIALAVGILLFVIHALFTLAMLFATPAQGTHIKLRL
ncbi:hypothetical protein HEQ62_09405 [Haematospirillum jordaniae]|uniref:hypothetical protein n=1 Tax=Haematospirillum jordaniae TaxID=1549855 RepID=UPI0012E76D6F|nr:hypothetical protein [Haematospirillum jordaniae]NKD44871.1 hypothetical protein [Haematospirillum jordaniae]NKD57896.1 hypothetical protein [Haematospirillum jordaniae]NKD59992.1 hypothetical protein [Haematospirillum jordaniae]NKD67930.1 hypothetical protein [Haematospirillum jordaniae]NKD80023.1 hypothetical protein [Haematospirillum jordaniae]